MNKRKDKNLLLIVIVLISYTFILIFSENIVFTNDFIYENLSTQMPLYSIEDIIASRDRFWWVVYFIQMFVILFKVLFATFCIFIGVVLYDIEFSFSNLFSSVINAEFIFIIAQASYLLNLYFNRAELTLDTTANYFPLCMLSFYGVENVVPWLHYPLQTLNLFEVLYIVFISWHLSKQWELNFVESLNIVIPSYGIGLFTWIALVVFLTLQIS